MTNEEQQQQIQRVREMDALRAKLNVSIEIAESKEQQAYRLARQYTTLGSLEIRNNLERAMNP
tara:strand:+ start:282 stop:470 length:189 start_codon:yes stop_codon:yes gene_type:complete